VHKDMTDSLSIPGSSGSGKGVRTKLGESLSRLSLPSVFSGVRRHAYLWTCMVGQASRRLS